MSSERARRWLEYYYTDVIDDVDQSIGNSNAVQEADIVLELAGYVWDLSKSPSGVEPGSEALKKMKSAFQVYVESLFNFDPSVGYSVHIDGCVWLEGEDSYIPTGLKASAIATEMSIHVDNDALESNELILKPHLKMVLHDDDKDKIPMKALVPIDSIVALSSIRANFYSQLNESI